MLEWLWPVCFTLLPLPWLACKLLPAYRKKHAAIRVPFFDDLNSTSNSATSPGMLSRVIAILVWIALVTTIARPMWYGDSVNIASSGRDLLLTIDISDSMRIDDMQIDGESTMRIEVVKDIASSFINRRGSDRIGLILFGQQAYLQSPLTFDHASLVNELKEAMPGFAGSSTAIGDAMGQAISLLRDRPAESRVVVLLSDGSNTYGSDPVGATRVAAEAGIRIHTIGLGAKTHIAEDVIGRKQEINPSRDLDENTLTTIAAGTGGKYFRAHNVDELITIYNEIDELEPVPADEFVRPQRSLYHWPLSAALVLSILLIAFRSDL